MPSLPACCCAFLPMIDCATATPTRPRPIAPNRDCLVGRPSALTQQRPTGPWSRRGACSWSAWPAGANWNVCARRRNGATDTVVAGRSCGGPSWKHDVSDDDCAAVRNRASSDAPRYACKIVHGVTWPDDEVADGSVPVNASRLRLHQDVPRLAEQLQVRGMIMTLWRSTDRVSLGSSRQWR